MLKETVEIKVDYEKAGVSSEGCAPVRTDQCDRRETEYFRQILRAVIT